MDLHSHSCVWSKPERGADQREVQKRGNTLIHFSASHFLTRLHSCITNTTVTEGFTNYTHLLSQHFDWTAFPQSGSTKHMSTYWPVQPPPAERHGGGSAPPPAGERAELQLKDLLSVDRQKETAERPRRMSKRRQETCITHNCGLFFSIQLILGGKWSNSEDADSMKSFGSCASHISTFILGVTTETVCDKLHPVNWRESFGAAADSRRRKCHKTNTEIWNIKRNVLKWL